MVYAKNEVHISPDLSLETSFYSSLSSFNEEEEEDLSYKDHLNSHYNIFKHYFQPKQNIKIYSFKIKKLKKDPLSTKKKMSCL